MTPARRASRPFGSGCGGLLGVAWLLVGSPAEAAEARYHLHAGDYAVEIATDTTRLESRFGPRFDATAAVVSVTGPGHSYLAGMGLADEFGLEGVGVLGYQEAPVGGTFLKIGVGILTKDVGGRYRFQHAYPVARRLPVEVAAGADQVKVTQLSGRVHGFQYRYEKIYRSAGEGVLVIDYALTNLGADEFVVEQYNHNFFSFDGAGGSEAYAVTAGFPWGAVPTGAWQLDGQQLGLSRPAAEHGDYWGKSFDLPAQPHRVTLRHRDGASVTISGGDPVVRFAIWADRDAICPEIFVRHTVGPGASARWSRRYQFGSSSPARLGPSHS